MHKCISLLISVFLIALLFSSCGISGNITVFDKNNNVLANIDSFSDDKSLEDLGNKVWFVRSCVAEAVEIISKQQKCDKTKAQEFLLKNNCSINTYFDQECFDLITAAYSELLWGAEFGCVLTDADGAVIATLSNSSYSSDNTTSPKNPYSTIKPLSVYAPALEAKIINWSTMFSDSEYKKIRNEDGNLYSWPANASNTYANKDVTVEYALKKSLNTVAVKCLAEYGVKNSLNFLSSKLGMNVNQEIIKAETYGYEEIIGNIALGYLAEGVSVLDMVGYYGMFLNDGLYTQPYFIKSITDDLGNPIFVRQAEKTKVISVETAIIMKNMLKEVVTAQGTGSDACVEGVEIAGKTGTGNNNDGNWFVGFSSEYCCAVWHGPQKGSNISPKVFSRILSGVSHINTQFREYSAIKRAAYCIESGKLLSDGCREIGVGFYTDDNFPLKCDIHG